MQEEDPVAAKVAQSIEKHTQLLTQGKPYEFSQKIKSLANRKTQTKKHQQAILLLKGGSRAMLSQPQPDHNEANQLLKLLLEIYKEQPSLWHNNTPNELHELLALGNNPKVMEHYLFVVKSKGPLACPKITEDLLSYLESNKAFGKAETIVGHLPIQRVTRFLEKWRECISNQEYWIVVCRMALILGLKQGFDESMVLLAEVPAQDPFVKFTRFLIQTVQMNSKEAFQKIGSGYKDFLASDGFFQKIYDLYGVTFFRKEKATSGLQNLLSSLE